MENGECSSTTTVVVCVVTCIYAVEFEMASCFSHDC